MPSDQPRITVRATADRITMWKAAAGTTPLSVWLCGLADAAAGTPPPVEARKAAAARVERVTGSRPKPPRGIRSTEAAASRAACRHGLTDCRVCQTGRFA